ncbi:hypothetical protein JW935_01700 [candidate division KSB1 bacterium]|nr:hypothetical protein [candidate division KSB1 bacterium]
MPSRITPLDVRAFCSQELYRKGEQIFENDLVKHRFQTNFGLQATVRSTGKYRIEMIVDGEQIFGRCSCHAGSTPCEHQVAVLLAWLNESNTFISYQQLRKSIRVKDKTTLIDILLNLIEIFPEISRFFVDIPESEEAELLREDVADIFDYPQAQKINPREIEDACQILFVRTKLLRTEGKWDKARILLFEILNRILSLVDEQQLADSFRENFIAELGDDYEEIVLNDPDFETYIEDIFNETKTLIAHDSAELEGVYLDQLRKKFGLETTL